MHKEKIGIKNEHNRAVQRSPFSLCIALMSVVATPFLIPLAFSLTAVLGISGAAATAVVAVAWLGAAAIGVVCPAAAPLTGMIQSMISTMGTSGAALW